MTTKNRVDSIRRQEETNFQIRRGEDIENYKTFFSPLYFRKRPESDQKNVLPLLASFRLVFHMITLLSSLVISLSETFGLGQDGDVAPLLSCLLCFEQFHSGVKRSWIDTRSTDWILFDISPSTRIFISTKSTYRDIDICYEMRLTVMSSVHFFMCASLSKCLRSNSYKLLWCKKRLLIMEAILALLSLLLLIVFEILHKLGSTPNPLGSKGCNIHIPQPSPTSNLLSFPDRILITR